MEAERLWRRAKEKVKSPSPTVRTESPKALSIGEGGVFLVVVGLEQRGHISGRTLGNIAVKAVSRLTSGFKSL